MSKLTVVRYERLRRGINTAADLARRAGVNRVRLTMFDSGGKYRHLDADEIRRISRALGIPRTAFADGDGAPLFVE